MMTCTGCSVVFCGESNTVWKETATGLKCLSCQVESSQGKPDHSRGRSALLVELYRDFDKGGSHYACCDCCGVVQEGIRDFFRAAGWSSYRATNRGKICPACEPKFLEVTEAPLVEDSNYIPILPIPYRENPPKDGKPTLTDVVSMRTYEKTPQKEEATESVTVYAVRQGTFRLPDGSIANVDFSSVEVGMTTQEPGEIVLKTKDLSGRTFAFSVPSRRFTTVEPTYSVSLLAGKSLWPQPTLNQHFIRKCCTEQDSSSSGPKAMVPIEMWVCNDPQGPSWSNINISKFREDVIYKEYFEYLLDKQEAYKLHDIPVVTMDLPNKTVRENVYMAQHHSDLGWATGVGVSDPRARPLPEPKSPPVMPVMEFLDDLVCGDVD